MARFEHTVGPWSGEYPDSTLVEFEAASMCVQRNLRNLDRSYRGIVKTHANAAKVFVEWSRAVKVAHPTGGITRINLWKGDEPFIGMTAHLAAITFAYWSDPDSIGPEWTWDQGCDLEAWDRVELKVLLARMEEELVLTRHRHYSVLKLPDMQKALGGGNIAFSS